MLNGHFITVNRQYDSLWKFSFDAADIFFEDLSVPNLLFHVTRFLGVSPKHEESRCQPVKTVNCPEVLQIVLLGQNEDHSVVTVSATWMNLARRFKAVNCGSSLELPHW